MMTWTCDRCAQTVGGDGCRNRRPDRWATVRLTRTGQHQAEQWVLCALCQGSLYAALRGEPPR